MTLDYFSYFLYLGTSVIPDSPEPILFTEDECLTMFAKFGS